ncbi:MAG TPA: ABC transporter permease [Methylomusa anaerophila]|uniref:Putative phospholipid ABC transporter permease protein MlaE n=1 Tax=Methylomusa anaerophila TaxID=1930071 RepID=A0A348AKE8_9FIRM|nr:ABC transporter permease [Methylomusa anaerophila]BBB91546.1 putative phospholipid ABC transporter permease protein MlaE [Methylomusa anaerophila]HML89516.1 ABC transporter permease [Methylomusa anaerophila]
MLQHFLSRIGAQVLMVLETIGQLCILTVQTIYHLPQVNGRHLIRQMAHLGVDSLPIVLLTMLFTGMVLTIQTAHEFIKYGAQSSVGGLVAIAMGRELSPVLTGVVVAGRVGAAITAEIGSMKVTEQIDALRVMAVNPIAYLVVPRLVACMIMVPLLVVFADIIGTIGGYMIATLYSGINSFTFMNSIKIFAIPHDVTGGLIKATFFGAIVALIGCHKGLTTTEGAEGVGHATTGSVVFSIILIFVSNYFLSVLLYR